MRNKFILSILIILIFINTNVAAQDYSETYEEHTETAKVMYVEQIEGEYLFLEGMNVIIEILTGNFKGQQFHVEYYLTGNPRYDLPLKEGDRVLTVIEEYDDGYVKAHIIEYAKDTYIYIVAIIFILLLLIVGKIKGLKSILTLSFTIFLIIKVLLPGILKGHNPILLTIIISFFITLVTLLIVGGINIKSFSAIIGVLGGVMVAGLIALFVGSKINLKGLVAEEAIMLMYIPQNIDFNFRGILLAGIILGALGAVMDVGISIASAMEEIKRTNPTISQKDLIISGMNVGKDIMGTMSNTLILAYTGSAIPILLLFLAYETDFKKMINLEAIATEIIRALSGSIGLIITIPLTAFAAGILFEKFQKIPTKQDE